MKLGLVVVLSACGIVACAGGGSPPTQIATVQPKLSAQPPPTATAPPDAGPPPDAAPPPPAEPPIRILAKNQRASTALATDDSDVFWIGESDGSINRVSRTGGIVETLYTANEAFVAAPNLVTDGEYVYWTQQVARAGGAGTAGAVKRQNKNVSKAETYSSNTSGDLRGIAVDDTSIFWIDSGAVLRAPKAGGPPAAVAGAQLRPTSVAADAKHVYWTNYGTPDGATKGAVMRAPRKGGTPATFAPDQEKAQNVWLDDANVYWVANDKIVRAPKDGATTVTVVAQAEGPVNDIALDDTSIYFTAQTSADEGMVARVAKEGGAIEKIASQQANPSAIAVTSRQIYWICRGTAGKSFGDGTVSVRAKQ